MVQKLELLNSQWETTEMYLSKTVTLLEDHSLAASWKIDLEGGSRIDIVGPVGRLSP